MKSFVAVALALVLLVGVAQAAEVPTSQGDKAMVFMFNGFDDLGLGGYPGQYGFGMRYYIADGTAIRGGVTFGKGTYTWADPDAEDTDDYEEDATTWGLEAILEKHLESPCAAVSPYWGVGAGLLSTSYTEKDPYYYYRSYEYEESSFGFQIFGAMGFEWAFTGCMTLGGEYRLGWGSLSSECKETYDYDPARDEVYECEETASFMGFSTASVFLSVYW